MDDGIGDTLVSVGAARNVRATVLINASDSRPTPSRSTSPSCSSRSLPIDAGNPGGGAAREFRRELGLALERVPARAAAASFEQAQYPLPARRVIAGGRRSRRWGRITFRARHSVRYRTSDSDRESLSPVWVFANSDYGLGNGKPIRVAQSSSVAPSRALWLGAPGGSQGAAGP